jgi:hypothetical protein
MSSRGDSVDVLIRALCATGASVITITVAPSLRTSSGVGVHVEIIGERPKLEVRAPSVEQALIEAAARFAILDETKARREAMG